METSPNLLPSATSGDDILVVDDEASVLALAQAIFDTVGMTPSTAHDGAQGLQWVEDRVSSGKPISLVILDLTMPGGMSGFETLEAIRDISPRLPVIACSGFFAEGARTLCQTIGFTDILAKPYTPDALLRLARGEISTTDEVEHTPADWESAAITHTPALAALPHDDLHPAAQDSPFLQNQAPTLEAEVEPAETQSKHRHPLMKGFGLF